MYIILTIYFQDIQRPTTKETDEDLLRQQELFFKNNNKAAPSIQSKETPIISLEESKSNAVKVAEADSSNIKTFYFI